jgi:hypothetical protein
VAVEGADELKRAFLELGDMNSSEWKSTLRAAVNAPAKRVIAQAKTNIAKISPGKTPAHRTYLGRIVAAGFAARSIRMKIHVVPRQGRAFAFIGVLKEAFYAISFFEFGLPAKGIPREPWLSTALESQQQSAVSETNKHLLRRIKAIARRRAKASAKKGSV